jgi:HSP20 family protein|tara:strand:- start:48 stop:527 length:480 start_codon:yes stop_codon:yes gene_type:complete
MTIVRRSALPARISRDEWLTPFDRLFDDMLGNMFPAFATDVGEDFFVKGSYPKVNVVNNEANLTIEAAIPGLTKEDVSVEIAEGVLTIQGSSNQRTDVENSQYVKREIKRSAFQRSFRLGENLDENNVTGQYDNGILTLIIPKIVPTEQETVVKTVEIK